MLRESFPLPTWKGQKQMRPLPSQNQESTCAYMRETAGEQGSINHCLTFYLSIKCTKIQRLQGLLLIKEQLRGLCILKNKATKNQEVLKGKGSSDTIPHCLLDHCPSKDTQRKTIFIVLKCGHLVLLKNNLKKMSSLLFYFLNF